MSITESLAFGHSLYYLILLEFQFVHSIVVCWQLVFVMPVSFIGLSSLYSFDLVIVCSWPCLVSGFHHTLVCIYKLLVHVSVVFIYVSFTFVYMYTMYLSLVLVALHLLCPCS